MSRSSPPLRPDPPASPAPPDFTSSAYTGGPARQLGLGCERHLPRFGSVFLPHVPSPLRREENQGPIPALRPCSMAFPTKTVSRLLQCSRHRLPSGPFSRRFFRCSLCYGPRGCSPSWTDPTWRDIALRLPRTFYPSFPAEGHPPRESDIATRRPGADTVTGLSPVGALPLQAARFGEGQGRRRCPITASRRWGYSSALSKVFSGFSLTANSEKLPLKNLLRSPWREHSSAQTSPPKGGDTYGRELTVCSGGAL